MQRDTKNVKVAFVAYQRLFASMGRRKPPSYESFAKSRLYPVFVRFGSYLINIQAINPLGFIDFLLRMEIPVDRWEHPTVYETYVRELNKSELPMEALERNIMLMQQWSIDTGNDWTDFFRMVAPAQATLWIMSGRISPWILLVASSAVELLTRLSPEQVGILNSCIDNNFWAAKLARHESDVEIIRQEMAAVGV